VSARDTPTWATGPDAAAGTAVTADSTPANPRTSAPATVTPPRRCRGDLRTPRTDLPSNTPCTRSPLCSGPIAVGGSARSSRPDPRGRRFRAIPHSRFRPYRPIPGRTEPQSLPPQEPAFRARQEPARLPLRERAPRGAGGSDRGALVHSLPTAACEERRDDGPGRRRVDAHMVRRGRTASLAVVDTEVELEPPAPLGRHRWNRMGSIHGSFEHHPGR
jgi:hypothetical protein